jgi:hypothetical protein
VARTIGFFGGPLHVRVGEIDALVAVLVAEETARGARVAWAGVTLAGSYEHELVPEFHADGNVYYAEDNLSGGFTENRFDMDADYDAALLDVLDGEVTVVIMDAFTGDRSGAHVLRCESLAS